MLEYIKHQNEIIAIILRKDFSKDGANFFSAPDDSFQFGILQYKKGRDIPAHRHIKIQREVNSVCEVLFIQSGKVKVIFYGGDGKEIGFRILNAGDTILLEKLGHGFKLLEDSKIIEIKQGPYFGREGDKKYIDL